jgi:predicted flap endonuclease-1-like 5' DNA nuclease
VRRGTRELLARIRQERIARADKTVAVAVEAYHSEPPVVAAGLMPDPTITRLSEQLIAERPRDAATAPLSPARQGPAPERRERSAPGRVTRDYDSARLGISPVNGDSSTLRLDLSQSRSGRGSAATQQRYAQLAGLQPFEPLPRGGVGMPAAPGAVASARPADAARVAALPGIETVPTLGPGLIWRLSQAGICTMADLAACDAASVRAKLGQLGRLVKVEDWIAHARAVVADPASASA